MMKNGNSLTVIQLNDSHAYFDLHQEMFWQGGKAVYRPAGGYARIAALIKQIRAANPERVLFCDCGDTLCFEFIGSRRDDGPLGPLSTEAALIKLLDQVKQAVANGATLVMGGERIDRPGAFMQPDDPHEYQSRQSCLPGGILRAGRAVFSSQERG